MDVAVRIALTLSRYLGEWYWKNEHRSLPSAARQAHFSLTEATSDEFVIVFCCIGLVCTAGFFFMLGMWLGWWCLCAVRGLLRGSWVILRGGIYLTTRVIIVTSQRCRVAASWRPTRRMTLAAQPSDSHVKVSSDVEEHDSAQVVLRERSTRTAVVRGRAVPQVSLERDSITRRTEATRQSGH